MRVRDHINTLSFEEQYEYVHQLSFTALSRKKDPSVLPGAREYVKGLRDGIKKDIQLIIQPPMLQQLLSMYF